MKALILNGSPRREGNSAFVSAVMGELLRRKYAEICVETLRLQELSVSPCIACDACKKNGGTCVVADDGILVTERAAEADVLVFVTPVYQSGISAQLKLAIDRLYAKGGRPPVREQLLYVIAIGADPLDTVQYSLIERQFASMSHYQNWNFSGYLALCASKKEELRNRPGVAEQLEGMLSEDKNTVAGCREE